jgi:hypothetical protein
MRRGLWALAVRHSHRHVASLGQALPAQGPPLERSAPVVHIGGADGAAEAALLQHRHHLLAAVDLPLHSARKGHAAGQLADGDLGPGAAALHKQQVAYLFLRFTPGNKLV